MAEVGLASVNVTFADVSVRVVSRLAEYHATAKDAPDVFNQIKTELPLAIHFLRSRKHECNVAIAAGQSTTATAGPSGGPVMAADFAQQLAAVVANCNNSVKKLEMLLGKALPLRSNSCSRRTLKALLRVCYEREITKIDSQLWQLLQRLKPNPRPQSATMAAVALRSDEVVDLQLEGLFEVLLMRVTYMVQRPLLLEMIDNVFSGRHAGGSSAATVVTGSVSDEPTVVVLLGLGGQGKTQLALEYCKIVRASGQFDTIVWLDASSA
jgi:hypothetical protein